MFKNFILVIQSAKEKLGKQLILLIFLMILNGLLEGIGVLSLIPLLNLVGIGEVSQNIVTTTFNNIFHYIGLEIEIINVVVIVSIIFVFQYSVFLLFSYVSSKIQNEFIALWRKELFFYYMNSSKSHGIKTRSSEIIEVITMEMNRIEGSFMIINQFVSTFIIASIYIAFSFIVSWQVTLIFILMSALISIIMIKMVKKGYVIGKSISENLITLQSHTNEYVDGHKLIKTSSTEEIVLKKFNDVVDRLKRDNTIGLFQVGIVRATVELCAFFVLFVVLIVGTYLFDMDPAVILVILALFIRLYPRLSSAQQNIQYLTIYLPSISILRKQLEEAKNNFEKLDDQPLSQEVSTAASAIKAENIKFSYDDNVVVNGINFEVKKGESVAFVGPSGSGKSTIVDTIMSLIDLDEGSLKINEHEISTLPKRAWRKSVGYVGQETILFNTSIKENITWGHQDFSQDDLEKACLGAHAKQFIDELPGGIDYQVGDHGMKLSGGQRQRLGLARALLGKPLLLILDEATSALDTEAEKQILNALDDLHGSMTIISIAHRLSTVKNADKIYFLEDGNIVESGTWDYLIDKGGRFAHFWKLQHS